MQDFAEVFNTDYACCEYKSISEPMPRRLADPEEARGQLLRIMVQEGMAVAFFPWGSIALPMELEARLLGLVGKKIGILRLDGYHVRCLDRER